MRETDNSGSAMVGLEKGRRFAKPDKSGKQGKGGLDRLAELHFTRAAGARAGRKGRPQ
jgi:hypothetical protein